MAKILITGGTGLVGSNLTQLLLNGGHEVVHLSRSVTGNEAVPTYKWNIDLKEVDPEAFAGIDHIIHLAGAGVADKKWTDERKQVIINSRVDSAMLLHREVKKQKRSLKSYISASAIGYYGLDTGDKILTEESPPGDDFLADVVKKWEASADAFSSMTKVAKVRIGVVLGEEGGALPKIAKPVRFFVGAPLGDGEQYMSWIHLDDLCRIFEFVLENNHEGTFNAVAPNPATNRELTRKIAKTLKRPLILPNVPAFTLKAMLGEMSGVVLGGNNVSSQLIQGKGFKFAFTKLDSALEDLL